MDSYKNCDENMSIEEFDKYKRFYKDLPEELKDFANKVRMIQMKSKRSWKKNNTNWIVKHKLNQDDDDKLVSNFKCILNKIGDNNFKEISQELLSLDIDTPDHLEKLADMIFNKAVKEDKYYTVYVKLCDLLYNKYVQDDDENKTYFRVILLNKCQETFVEALDTDCEDELKDIGLKNKLDLIGLVKLISGLYNNSLITNSIIYDCLFALTVKVNDNKWYAIDCLCTMMNCVMKQFETNCPDNYRQLIDFLLDLTKDKKIKSKDRFAIMDVLGL